MNRFGLALALLIAVYAALLYAPLFFKASDYLRGHVAARSEDDEAAVRISGMGQAWAGNGFIHLTLLPVLSAGLEGAL